MEVSPIKQPKTNLGRFNNAKDFGRDDEPYSMKHRKKQSVDTKGSSNRYLNSEVNQTFDGLDRIKIKKKSQVHKRRAYVEPTISTAKYELFDISSAGP